MRGLDVLVAEQRALDLAAGGVGLDDHPRVVAAGELDRLVQLVHRLDPADADAGAESRGLDPERRPHRLAALAPARLPRGGEIDLRQAGLGEEPLQGQLVHADRRGEHVGADVGEVEPLEYALHAAVLAEGAVQSGEGDLGAVQSLSRHQRHRRALDAPGPGVRDRHLDRLVPGPLQPPRHRLSRAQRDVVLGGAATAEDRDPHSPVASVSAVPARGLADDQGHGRARLQFRARRRELVGDAADLRRDFGLLFGDDRLQPRGATSSTASARSLPITFGAVAFSSPLETTIETVEPGGSCEPALGACEITCPAGAELCRFFDAGRETAPADLLHGDAALRPDQDRDLGQLRPAGDPQQDFGAAFDGLVRRRARVLITSPSSTFSECTSSTFESRPAPSSASSASARAGAGGGGDLGAARPGAHR